MFNRDSAIGYLEKMELDIGTSDINYSKSELVDVVESLVSIIESFNDNYDIEDTEEVITEGANLDSRKKFIELKKDAKLLTKQYRAALKDNDFNKARKLADLIIDDGNKIVKEIQDIEGDALSTVIGNAIETVRSYAGIIIIGLASGFSAGGVVTAIGVVTKAKLVSHIAAPLVAGDVAVFVSAIEKRKKEVEDLGRVIHAELASKNSDKSIDSLNKYRNRLIHSAEKIVSNAEILKKAVDEKEKAYNEKRAEEKEIAKEDIKESANDLMNRVKRAVYEDCQRGLITIEERENKIDELRNIIYSKQIIAEESSDIDNHATKEEAFATIKKAIYERCAAGEFSEDVREELIHKTYDRIFIAKEDFNNTSNNVNTSNMNKELEKAAKDAQKNIEKNNSNYSKKISEELDRGLTNPPGDAPIKEDTDDLDALVAKWDAEYNETSFITDIDK